MDSEWPGGAWIEQGDALNIPMRDESVDLIVTSPPYFALRSYTDGGEHYDGQIGSEPTPQAFLEALWAVTAECKRVLKPSGSMWVNLGDKYAGSGGHNNSGVGAKKERAPSSYNKASNGIPAKSLMGLPWRYAIGCIDQLGLILRAEVVWSKPNGLPESVTDRVRRSHEQWFHFTKEPRYFAAVDEVREPHAEPERSTGKRETGTGKRAQVGAATNGMFSGERVREYSPLGKLPGSVWTIPSEPLKVPDHLGVDHFAAYPQEWPRRIILGWSPSGICTACGDGRRPVVAKEVVATRGRVVAGAGDTVPHVDPDRTGAGRGWQHAEGVYGRYEAAITGYACACATPDAPTRPAVVLDPFGGTGTTVMVARALGRFGVSLDLSADYNRLARWRVWQSGHEYKTLARIWAEKNGAMVDGKPKIPAKIKREIEAEMTVRRIAQIRQSKKLWEQVRR